MSPGPSHLVQILLPKETGSGQSVARQWFENLLKDSGGEVERDNIAVIEVMVENLDPEFWRFLRGASIRRRRSSSGHKK